MNNDIVSRLRNWHDQRDSWQTLTEAADEIQRLRARVDHWKLMYETALKLYYNEHGRLPNE